MEGADAPRHMRCIGHGAHIRMTSVSTSKLQSPSLCAALVTLLSVFLSLTVFSIFKFNPLGPDLDASWAAALVEQTARGASQGRDVIFTGGPLSIIYSRYFHPDLGLLAVGLSGLIVLLFAHSTYLIVRYAPSPWVGLLLLLPFLLPGAVADPYFFAVPLLFLIARLYAPPGRRALSSLLFAIAAAALVAAKFSVLPIVVLVALLLDVDGLVRKSAFPHLIAFFLALFLVHVGTGSRGSDFLLYLTMSLDTSAFYADAMSLTGNWRRLILFIFGALVFAWVLAIVLVRNLKSDAPKFREVAAALGMLGFLFLCFKAGFVRFDLHEIAGWMGLVWVSALLLVLHPPASSSAAGIVPVRLIIPILCGVVGLVLALLADRHAPDWPWKRVAAAATMARYTFDAATHPAAWWQSQVDARAASFAAIKSTMPLPKFEGTVDVIGSRQSMLIANGSNFAFRPTVQEYTTYSPRTIAANRAFFEGAKAPDNLLLAPGSIDGRIPASAEGPLWPLFFSRYQVKGMAGGQVWMVKRNAPVPDILGAPQVHEAKFGVPFQIDASGPLFIQMDIGKTLPARLASIAFRPPQVMMTVTLSDGRMDSFRIIPAIAQAGFMLSPLVMDVWDMARLLNSAQTRAELPRVTSITLERQPLQGLFFNPDIAITLRPMTIPYSDAGDLKVPGIVAIATREKFLKPPLVVLAEDGLFAHAPSSLPVTASGSAVDIRFGIRDGATEGRAPTDGACFRVVPASSDTPLFEKCLRPTTVAADRGVHAARIPIPPGVTQLKFETTCAGSCASDWTYWSEIEFR